MMPCRTRSRTGRALGAVLLLASAACARHAIAPPRPAAAPTPAKMEAVNLYLRAFRVIGLGPRDTVEDVEALQDRLLDFIEAETALGSTRFNLSGRQQLVEPALELVVDIEIIKETHRTWVLDIFAGATALLWPVVPVWGDLQASMHATIRTPDGAVVRAYRYAYEVPFSTVLYGWFRRAYVQRAYQRAYTELFHGLAVDLGHDAPSLVTVATGESPAPAQDAVSLAQKEPAPPPDDEDPAELDDTKEAARVEGESHRLMAGSSPAESLYRRAANDDDVVVLALPDEGFHVITTDESEGYETWWLNYLAILGGVEASKFWGTVNVSSRALDGDGLPVEVASGSASQDGFRIGLYTAPETTGFFIYPSVGYMQQSIGNIDARSELGRLNTVRNAEEEIPALASNPDSGLATDPGTANVYHLDMKSGYAGARAGLDLVTGNDLLILFVSGTLGLNLVEVRSIHAELDACGADVDPRRCTTERNAWDFFASGTLGGTLGFELPKLHLAFRMIVDWEWYRKFRYGRALEVRGPAEWDAVNQIFQHPRLQMRAASLSAWNFQLAGSVVF